jgi:hypothetical protein
MTAFALRVPQEVRNAAEALVNAAPSEGYRWEGMPGPRSLNDALLLLMKAGASCVAEQASEFLERAGAGLCKWERLVTEFPAEQNAKDLSRSKDAEELLAWADDDYRLARHTALEQAARANEMVEYLTRVIAALEKAKPTRVGELPHTDGWPTAPKDGSTIKVQFPDGTKTDARYCTENHEWQTPRRGKWATMKDVHGLRVPVVWWR